MSSDNINKEQIFIQKVASIFEENCLHIILKSEDVEKSLIFCSNYCLDNLKNR